MEKNSFRFSFEKKEPLTDKQKVEKKIYKRIVRNRKKNHRKMDADFELIEELMDELQPGESLQVISREFDSPNVINLFREQIEELYISTWALTTAGLAALEEICSRDHVKEAMILIDTTHSYKWVFTSGAYEILRGKITIKFADNHSKIICMRMVDGSVLTITGSMNMSRNPRWENALISKDPEDFAFYSEFLRNVKSRPLKDGKKSTAGQH